MLTTSLEQAWMILRKATIAAVVITALLVMVHSVYHVVAGGPMCEPKITLPVPASNQEMILYHCADGIVRSELVEMDSLRRGAR